MAEAARWKRDCTGTARADKPWLDGLLRLIFVSDMGDALSERGAIIGPDNKKVPGGAVPFEYLKDEIIDPALSEKGRRHCWLWLTKRPHRLAQFCDWLRQHHGLELPQNIWVGTSVTSKRTLSRIAQLRKVGNARTLRFLSVEPLWEEISLAGGLDGIQWVIVGGESGRGSVAEEFRCEWARKLRDECQAVGVRFFLKQLGRNATDGGKPLALADSHGGDWTEWPKNLRVRQMPVPNHEPEPEPQSALHQITVHGRPLSSSGQVKRKETIMRNRIWRSCHGRCIRLRRSSLIR